MSYLQYIWSRELSPTSTSWRLGHTPLGSVGPLEVLSITSYMRARTHLCFPMTVNQLAYRALDDHSVDLFGHKHLLKVLRESSLTWIGLPDERQLEA